MGRGSIRGIFIMIYLAAMMIAMVLGIGIYKVATGKEKLAEKYLEELETTRTCEDFLSLIINKVDENSLELTLDSHVVEAFEQGQLEENVEVGKIVGNWVLRNEEVKSVELMGLNGQLLSVSRLSTDKHDKEDFKSQFSKEVMEKINEKEGQIYVGIGSDYVDSDKKRSLFVARRINGVNRLETIGYMFYFLDHEVLKERLDEYLQRNQFQIVLVDSEEHILNFGESGELKKIYTLYRANALDKAQTAEWESSYHHVELVSTSLGLRLLGKYITEPRDSDVLNIVIALSLINLIFLAVGTIAVRAIVIEPLEKISQVARQISEEGLLSKRFEVDSKYREGSIIAEALNEMLTRINELIKEGEEREMQRRVLELSVINHQVNPHFLFNTLNSVSLLLAVEDQKTALKLVKGLAKYYRACLSQENNVNTIEQELVIMKEYVHIAELKNPDLIRLILDVDEEVYSKKIPRMILQTLVENSIKYGIKTMEEPLQVKMTIKADYDRERTIIEIYDNGKGMEDSIKESILRGGRLKNKSGFGLKSTIKRINLLYQIKNVNEIMEIDSKLGEYTSIKLYVPWEEHAKKYNKDAYSM